MRLLIRRFAPFARSREGDLECRGAKRLGIKQRRRRLCTAIRIPEAGKSFRAKRMVSEGRASASKVEELEARCMGAMRRFDRDEVAVNEVLDSLEEYDQLITPDRPPTRELLRETLEARPWRSCLCDICRRDGIQVVIFRGNNRNRRRGFHSTYVFYRLLQRALPANKLAFFGPA